MKKHWYKYAVTVLLALNAGAYLLYFFLPDIPTNCNTCSPDGWCTMLACPLVSDIVGAIFNLLMIVSLPLLVVLTIVKTIFHLRKKKSL